MRARSTECAGAVALAVGREAFAPFLARLLGLAFDGMKLGEFELRESTYNFFGLVAHTFGEHFAPAVSDVVACMLATCRSDDGVVLHAKEDAFGRTRDPAQQGAGAFEPDKMTARFARHLRPPSVRPALARLLFFFLFEARVAVAVVGGARTQHPARSTGRETGGARLHGHRSDGRGRSVSAVCGTEFERSRRPGRLPARPSPRRGRPLLERSLSHRRLPAHTHTHTLDCCRARTQDPWSRGCALSPGWR